ncbi:hypothetical protein FGG08_005127 [Glutinoglossum americanum]|uniref:Domain of unknown function at the cortex 1 domain-containing protein n=1 Tax=Glutinoglossum americanum TaxID=1670608 RepID=A0A9P8HZ14_9PEZI|nr:hypothetical protein FGG08_005127 [Glutinoglossum americanum]
MAAGKYYLQVTAGPSYDRATHKLVNVNSPSPFFISQPHADINLSVKIRGYRGLPEGSPSTSPYFSHPNHLNDQYSISFALLPKTPIRGDQLVFGNDFDNPIRDRLPPGFNTGLKIVKWFIDPGLDGDVYSDTPYLYGPALSSLNVLRVGERADQLPVWRDKTEILEEGGDRGEAVPAEPMRRMRYFLEDEARKGWIFEEGRIYEGDFFNGYLDFNELTLRLPGFTLPVLNYLNGRLKTLRYVLKNRESGLVYFVVVFTLLRKDGRDGGDEGATGSESYEEVVVGVEAEKVGNMNLNDRQARDMFVPKEDDLD